MYNQTFRYNEAIPGTARRGMGTMGGPLNASIPGFNALSSTASGIIGNLMGGMPSAAPTQRANAYFGAGSGMPNSDFVRNRGFDLYGEEAEKHKQRGFDNFLNLLKGYSGTVMPTFGQQQQQRQFDDQLDVENQQNSLDDMFRRSQFDFQRKQWGADRPWTSSSTGSVFDRLGRRLGHDAESVRRY